MESTSLARPGAAGGRPPRRLQAPSPRYGEKVIQGLLAFCGLLSVLTTTLIVISLIGPTLGFFEVVPVDEFLFGTSWSPQFEPPSFGVLEIVAGTLNVTLWAMVFAVPIGLGSAVYLSEYANPRVRKVVKPVLEILAGIPTVAIGLFAFAFLNQEVLSSVWPGDFLGGIQGVYLALGAGLGIGMMCVPIIASISEDAMSSVPDGLREGAYAMGATKMEVATRVVFPAAISGIVASIVLAISRALGETMIVLLAAGSQPNLTLNPVEAIQAMTAYIATTSTGDIGTGTLDYKSVFAVGSVLFVLTLIMNMIAIRLVRRFREVYD